MMPQEKQSATKLRMNMAPSALPGQSKSPRKTRGPSTEAEKAILAELGDSDNYSPNNSMGALNVAGENESGRSKARESMIPGSRTTAVNPVIEKVQNAPFPSQAPSSPQVRKSYAPPRAGFQVEEPGVPKSRFGKVGQHVASGENGQSSAQAKNSKRQTMFVGKDGGIKEEENLKPELAQGQTPLFGTSVQLDAQAKKAKRQTMFASNGSINRRSENAFAFDNGLGGVGPTEVLDLRHAKTESKEPQISIIVSDEKPKVSAVPSTRRPSLFGTTIMPDAQKHRRKSSFSGAGAGGINRRADEVFGFDNGLGGVGPTELLDLRNVERKKSGQN
jgi:hypothetical protein